MVRPLAAAQSSVVLMALLRRSMPAELSRDCTSTSRSIRVTLYVVMSFSNCPAIELTLVQLSASSVPELSAAYPPNDGTTSPPLARIVLMSLPNVDVAIGMPVSPFQYAVQEPWLGVWMKAMVRYLAPDWADSPDRLLPAYASKYGANTWAGSGVPVAALAEPLATTAATEPAATTSAPMAAWTRRDRRMWRPQSIRKLDL